MGWHARPGEGAKHFRSYSTATRRSRGQCISFGMRGTNCDGGLDLNGEHKDHLRNIRSPGAWEMQVGVVSAQEPKLRSTINVGGTQIVVTLGFARYLTQKGQ